MLGSVLALLLGAPFKIGVVALDVLGFPVLCVDAFIPLTLSISGGG